MCDPLKRGIVSAPRRSTVAPSSFSRRRGNDFVVVLWRTTRQSDREKGVAALTVLLGVAHPLHS